VDAQRGKVLNREERVSRRRRLRQDQQNEGKGGGNDRRKRSSGRKEVCIGGERRQTQGIWVAQEGEVCIHQLITGDGRKKKIQKPTQEDNHAASGIGPEEGGDQKADKTTKSRPCWRREKTW